MSKFALAAIAWLCVFGLSRSAAGQELNGRRPPGLDGEFADLAVRIPGFGGYYFDGNGDLVVQLADLKQEANARSILAEVAASRVANPRFPTPHAEIKVRAATYGFDELHAYRRRLREMPFDGWQTLDTNEARNRVVVGVLDERTQKIVLQIVKDMGIPIEAVAVEIEEPVTPAATLRDYLRPLVGGLEVEFNSSSVCTLGVNVWYGNASAGIPTGTKGFFTAAHCGGTRGVADTTAFRQGGTRVGEERYDPPFVTTNAQDIDCPSGYLCRYSDVMFVAYDSGVSRKQGYIVQTTYRGFGGGGLPDGQAGSLTINATYPDFSIFQTKNPVMGEYLDKVGRTTGWTTGPVVGTCLDFTLAGSKMLLCQQQVQAFADDGDSGSPVFLRTSNTTAAFAGILFAKQGNRYFFFTKLNQIADDMGNVITYAP